MSIAGTLAALPRRTLILLVRFYRYWFKPWLGSACRFEPTCSQYALDALQRHGGGPAVFVGAVRGNRIVHIADGVHAGQL